MTRVTCAQTAHWLLMLAILWPAAPARAAEVPVQITPMMGYRGSGAFEDPDTGADLDLEDSESVGLVVNFPHGTNTEWEFALSRQRSDLRTGTSAANRTLGLDIVHASAGGIYVWRDPRAEPFVGAGVGLTYMNPDDSRYDSETRLLFSLVGGYRFRLTEHVGLRVELRGYQTLMSSDAAVFCDNGACVARVDGTGFGQLEFNVGVGLRF